MTTTANCDHCNNHSGYLLDTFSAMEESTLRRYNTVNPLLQDRRDAKAAASHLRCTHHFLESYRLSVLGRCEPDKRVQLAIMPSYYVAVRKFRAVAYPGMSSVKLAALQRP